ncbi:hypothetical protein [Sphaerotilus sp.]|uniref:hypothetical protein n=1 Tax=Sphaerotilus sp. TaxID=2093942 RepID=UPI002ACE12B0|nr:hypothetical protein [Sphaerotilus sp.]MDZ7855747.1 hypothetical protein [Sphaerotilus sp.]
MTFLVAIHAGSYVLLAADKMESVRVFDQSLPLHSTASKIVDTPLGAITGAGLVSLLDAVKARIQAEPVSHTDQVLSIIHDERDRARGQGSASEQDLAYTSWLLTYRAPVGGDIAVRCVGFLPVLEGRRFVVVEQGMVMPVFPLDTPPETVHRVTGDLRSDVRVADEGTRADSLRHHLGSVCRALCDVAASSSQVSTTFDFAVTTREGTWCAAKRIDALHPALDEWPGMDDP